MTDQHRTTQMRYTDSHLLELLETLMFDYGKAPTQRMVLADPRLPTHHTYRARFGSIKGALGAIGLDVDSIGNSGAQHKVLGTIIERMGGEIVGEYVPLGSILVDYEFTYMGQTYFADLVGIDGTVDILSRNMTRRKNSADAALHGSDGKYVPIMDAVDILEEFK